MAADTALLTALAEGTERQPVLRVYTWDRAAVSLGRLQQEEMVRRQYPGLPLVRRPTGGRAVLHGEDLTLAAALRIDALPEGCRTVLGSYRSLAGHVAAAFDSAGRDVCYSSEPAQGQHEVVDCFAVSAGCDLVDARTGQKLMGSAQRRVGAALLQQMSIPLRVIPDRKAFFEHLQQRFEPHGALEGGSGKAGDLLTHFLRYDILVESEG